MANKLQVFASGVLLTTILTGTAYYALPTNEQNNKKAIIEKETLTTEEMLDHLEKEGYPLTTEALPIAEETREDEIVEEASEQEPLIIYSIVLEVSKGMSSIDVAEKLTESKVINDQKAFIDELEKQNKSADIQIGHFNVNSEMTLTEIIDKLT